MPITENFRRQVGLLLRTIPFIAKETCFALKGGTAINLFVRDLPRLSVDIDLTYVHVFPRERSLGAIDKAMKRIGERVEKNLKRTRVARTLQEGATTKLVIREDGVQIKVEVTPVLRGCAFDPEQRSVSPAVEAQFGFAEMPVVSFADLFAGKIVAALDRQHPRDLFDVRLLLANEGITDDIRAAFIVYLLSHKRPMAEVLGARPKDIATDYHNNFVGMAVEHVALDDLLTTRTNLVAAIVGGMPAAHRQLLIGFEKGKPDWDLLGLARVDRLPAVLWRLQNLDSLTKNKRTDLVAKLEAVLGQAITPAQLTLLSEKSAPTRKRSRKRK
jgi:predicted nucleotidyltransferase component of viral defense system